MPRGQKSDRLEKIIHKNTRFFAILNKSMPAPGKNVQNGNKEQYYGVGGFILEIVKVFLLALIIIVPIRAFLFQPFFVQGASMEPNFENNQYLIINEFGYKQTEVDKLFTIRPFKEIQRQTVVVFRYPKNPGQFFIKRVIGLPGEKVQIKNGQVTIFNPDNPDGFVLDESAYLFKNLQTQGDVTVDLKSDQYFVMGDNRPYSSDSRSWGPLPKADIIGKVILRAWPLDQISVY